MGRLATWSIIAFIFTGCGIAPVEDAKVVEPTVAVVTIEEPAVPLVAVVPHHDLVAEQRTQLFKELSAISQPETIILVSPNHFSAGYDSIQTTDRIWSVAGGTATIEPNQAVIDALVDQLHATIEDGSFGNEHGIKNILGDFHTYFPNSKIVPLVLKDIITPEAIIELSQLLALTCADCGLIASVDMSHYNPAAVADIHDIKTLRALEQLDETDVWNVEVDSQPSLALLLAWAKQQQVEQFVLTDHTNSGTLLGDAEAETTTHLLGYYREGIPEDTKGQITFTVAGDMMLGREIGYQFQDQFSELFTNLGNRLFWGTDVSWANVEGPVSDQTIIQDRQPDHLIFNFSKEAIDVLTYLRLTTAGLANNHTANQGRSGLDTTRQVITQAGVDVVGDPYGITEDSVQRYTADGVTLSMIAVNVFDGDLTGLTELIATEDKAGNRVMVIPHWGNEYQTTHSAKQEQLATDWIEAGADLIIGMHPHVVQDAQVIQNKLVLYSLGNFIFDQTFSKETQQGLIVTGAINSSELKLVLVPIVSRQLKPELAKGDEKAALIDRICQNIQAYCIDGTVLLKDNGVRQ